MPRPLRIDQHGAKVFADWKRTASDTDVELVGQVLKRLEDDTWEGRWHSQEDVGDPKVTVISPRDNLLVSARINRDAGRFDLDYIGPDPSNWPEYRM